MHGSIILVLCVLFKGHGPERISGAHVRAAVKCEEASKQPQGQQFRQKEVEREFYCCYNK